MSQVCISFTAKKETRECRIAMQRQCKVDSAELTRWIERTTKEWQERGYSVTVVQDVPALQSTNN